MTPFLAFLILTVTILTALVWKWRTELEAQGKDTMMPKDNQPAPQQMPPIKPSPTPSPTPTPTPTPTGG